MSAQGLNEVVADLTKAALGAALRARVALVKRSAQVEQTAKELAPRDTELTAESIEATVDGLTAEIGPTTWWAHFPERGTVDMPPQAFMGPALDRHAADFVNDIADVGGNI